MKNLLEQPVSRLVATLLALACTVPAWAVDVPTSNLSSSADRLNAARSAIAAQDWLRAQIELRAALAEAPDLADAHNLLGFSLRKQTPPDVNRALFHYRQALQIDPAHKGAHEYIGEAYLMMDRPDLARQHLQSLEQLCQRPPCEERDDLRAAIANYMAKPGAAKAP
jgi:Tfp pilus assembly protein PilF